MRTPETKTKDNSITQQPTGAPESTPAMTDNVAELTDETLEQVTGGSPPKSPPRLFWKNGMVSGSPG